MIDSVPYFLARIADDTDFLKLKELAENHDGWNLDYDKSTVKVWTKHVDNSSFNMVKLNSAKRSRVKAVIARRWRIALVLQYFMRHRIIVFWTVWAVFSGVTCTDLYDTIQDPEYRKEWDNHMMLGIDIGYLNSNNDISYYAMYCPPPIKNRDLVLQKSWLDAGSEFFIINHSVCHKDYPPRKGFIRALSFFTGYFIKCRSMHTTTGCELSYVTRSDPQGDLPSWLVNKVTQILAPRYIRQIEKAAARYGIWKSMNNPTYKPWVRHEQRTSPKVYIRDCVPSPEELAVNSQLRKFDFESYLSTIPTDSRPRVGPENKDRPNQQTPQASSSTRDTPDGPSPAGSSRQPGTKSNPPSRYERRKSKNKINSFLNFARICGKRSEEE